MSNKRSRDTGSALAKDIRTSVGDDSKEEVERRTKYIKWSNYHSFNLMYFL